MKRKANFLFVVQAYDGSHDIAARELMKHSRRIKGDIITHVDLAKGMHNLDLYDIILCYVWQDTGTIDILKDYAHRVVICMAAGHLMDKAELAHFDRLPKEFNVIGHVNMDLFRFFCSRNPNKLHLYLTHGVDTDLFKVERAGGMVGRFIIGWVGDPDDTIKRYDIMEKIRGVDDTYALFTATDLSRESMAKFYNSIDCLIVTSDFEAHPLPVYEAMSSGIPVITPNVGDVSDYIINFVNGFIINGDRKPESYASAIQYLRDNEEYNRYIRKTARMTVLQRLSWEKIVPSYEHLIPETLIEQPEELIKVEGNLKDIVGDWEPYTYHLNKTIKAISWGGNFFLDLVTDDLKERCDFEKLDRALRVLPEDMDALYVVSPRVMYQSMYRKVLDAGIDIIWHWIGSDILSLRDEFDQMGRKPDILQHRPEQQHHLGVSQNLVEELKEMGIEAKELNLVSNMSLKPKPLPDEFTVLIYYPPPEQSVYNQEATERIIRKCKDIKFILYGLRKGQKLDFRKPRNVELDYWREQDDMEELYAKGSCLLRFTHHDGYPSSTIEACMMGRQVVTNGKFPYTIHVTTEEEVIEALYDIKDWKKLNIRGSQYYNKNQKKEVFINNFIEYLREAL